MSLSTPGEGSTPNDALKTIEVCGYIYNSAIMHTQLVVTCKL